MGKPNCCECEYREKVPGSCHSSCKHPKIEGISDDPMTNIMGMLASVGRVSPFMVGAEKLGIKGLRQGIEGGWFTWPVNFDPTWLISCNGFMQKGIKNADNKP